MYLSVTLLVWLTMPPFVISNIIITVTPEGPVSLTPSRGSRLANTRPPSSTAVPSMDLGQSSRIMSPLITLTTSAKLIPTLSSSGPSYQKSKTMTRDLPYSEATEAPLGTTSTFRSSAKLPVQETTSLLSITYITSSLPLASTESFSANSAVRNYKKLASIALALAIAFITI